MTSSLVILLVVPITGEDMKKKKIAAVICAGLLIATAIYAYFQSKKMISLGQATTASVDITLEALSQQTGRLLPGQSMELEWKVTNTGNASVYTKGNVRIALNVPGLDSSMFSIESIKRQDTDGSWLPVSTSGDSGNEFYFSVTGSEQNLIIFEPAADEVYKVEVKLAESAGDEYQNVEFSTDVEMVAKQLDTAAPWPEFSE